VLSLYGSCGKRQSAGAVRFGRLYTYDLACFYCRLSQVRPAKTCNHRLVAAQTTTVWCDTVSYVFVEAECIALLITAMYGLKSNLREALELYFEPPTPTKHPKYVRWR
jgi:hypothetical protein